MFSSDHIVDVTEADFSYQVLQYSQQKPVVVDFWAEWCVPCHTLSPILERLAENGNGQFRLAKVNVDENPNLAMQYNVRGIPAVKGIRNGQVVSEFVGVITEAQIITFLRELAPGPHDLALSKAKSLLKNQEWEEAEGIFREVLEERRDEPGALLGLTKSLLATNQADEAMDILMHFPTSREYARAEKLLPLAEAFIEEPISNGEDEMLSTMYDRALTLFQNGNFAAAMDGLLEVLRRNKNYRDGKARIVLLAIFELLGDDSQIVREYRAELASVLF